MAANIDEKNDFDKGTVTLKVSEVLGEALAELAAMSDDLLASDHPGADLIQHPPSNGLTRNIEGSFIPPVFEYSG